MTTNEEILRKECVFTSNWKLEKHRIGITECTYAFLDEIMSLARQDERIKIKETGRQIFVNEFKSEYERGAKDERERILVCTGCKKSIEKSCIIYGIHCNSCENKYHTITYEKGKKDTEEHRDWCIKMHIDNSLEHKDCSFCKLKQAGRNEVEKELIGLSANEMAKRQAEKIAALKSQLLTKTNEYRISSKENARLQKENDDLKDTLSDMNIEQDAFMEIEADRDLLWKESARMRDALKGISTCVFHSDCCCKERAKKALEAD